MGRKAEKCGVWSVKYRDIDRYIYIYIFYIYKVTMHVLVRGLVIYIYIVIYFIKICIPFKPYIECG